MSHPDLESLSTEELEAELARRRAQDSPLRDLTALEDTIDAEAARLKQASLMARVASLPPESGGPQPCPRCGRQIRVRIKNKERRIRTRSGVMTLRRHYHYCDSCRGGFFPRDRALGLPAEGDVSYGLEERIVDLALNETYERAAQRWSVHYMEYISANLVRRVVDRVGKRCESSDECYLQHSLQEPHQQPSDFLMVQTDGSMLPMRGSEPWKEVKLGVVVRTENHLQGSKGHRGAISEARYVGVLGAKKEFSESLDKVLQVEQVHKTSNVVWVGDGAPWIWNLASTLSPKAIQILDWYHAVEHALECGQALLRGSSLFNDWEKTCRHLLARGQIDELVRQLMDCLEYVDGEAVKAINDLIRYYRNNAERMRYDVYHAAGLPIGSGIVESAHGHVIQQRMKLTGQRWSMLRARRMVRLRAAYRTAGPLRFHRALRIAAEATRVAPIPTTKRKRASNR